MPCSIVSPRAVRWNRPLGPAGGWPKSWPSSIRWTPLGSHPAESQAVGDAGEDVALLGPPEADLDREQFAAKACGAVFGIARGARLPPSAAHGRGSRPTTGQPLRHARAGGGGSGPFGPCPRQTRQSPSRLTNMLSQNDLQMSRYFREMQRKSNALHISPVRHPPER